MRIQQTLIKERTWIAQPGSETRPTNRELSPDRSDLCRPDVECRQAQFRPPGAGTSEVTDEADDEKYQCCIHPWMRTVVHVAEK